MNVMMLTQAQLATQEALASQDDKALLVTAVSKALPVLLVQLEYVEGLVCLE